MAVDGGARDVEDVGDLLDGALAGVVGLLRESDLLRVEPGSPATPAALSAGGGEPVAGVGQMSSRWSSASTESIPNIARPSTVAERELRERLRRRMHRPLRCR